MTAGLGVSFENPELEASVRAGVDAVEAALAVAVHSDDEFLSEVSRYATVGGKRFRPLLSVLSAHLGDPTRPEVVSAAVVIELTHLATLYHDDVMDEAVMRHGTESANARWTNTVAILSGDFLFSRASDLLADLGPAAVRMQAQTFARLVTGQLRETVGPRGGMDRTEHYLSVLADKTGSLIATAAQFGAMFAGAAPEVVDAARRFGEQIGVAFQLSDDLLDIVAETDASGKRPGTDLREGVATLPVLYALRSTDPAEARLRELLSNPIEAESEVAEALGLLRASPALTEARRTVELYASRARVELADIPDLPARQALDELATAVVVRTG
ncbi:MAG: polyprenyl synthetase family protein [Jatrophihabitans sp.]